EKVQYTQALNKYKSERQQLDEHIESLNFQLVKATEEVEKYAGQLNVLEERKKNQSQTNARFEEEQESLKIQTETLKQEKIDAQNQIDKLKNQQKELNEKIQYFESQLYVSDEQHDEKLETIKDEYYQLMSEQSDVNNDIRFLEHTIQENETKQSRLDSRLLEAFEQLKKIQSDINEAEKQTATAQKELKKSEQQLNNYEKKLTQLKQQQSEYEEKLHQAYRFNDKLKSRIDSLATQQEEYSYFFNGVKHILKAKDNKLSGIRGAVAEVIQVPSDLTKAIETALGASLQHVIVDSEKDGRQAIQYLKQNGLGRATFLPLNVIQPRQIGNEIMKTAQNSEGFINIAAHAIEVYSDYQNVVQNLLGNTISVDELKNANDLARKIRYRTRIVTLEGDIVNPGGSMTGGGDRKSKSILAQKDELTTMRAQLEDYQQQTLAFEKQFQNIKNESDQLSEKYFDTSQHYNAIKQSVHNYELELDRLRKSEAHLKGEHEEFEFEKNDGYQSETSKQTLDDKKQRLSKIKTQLQKLEDDINLYTKLSKEGKESTTQIQQQLHQKQSDLAVVKERLNTQKQTESKIAKQLNDVIVQHQKLEEQIKLFNSDEMTGEKAFETIQYNMEQSKAEKAKLSQNIEDVKSRRLELNDTIEVTDQKLQEANQDILSIENRYQDIKAEQSRLDVLINHA
ncbi:MAG: chromosome segregation protein SMC, partial [Staphylococcus equorum]|nr:chromosome segregation protein SMC [Staphylococcus equorum]